MKLSLKFLPNKNRKNQKQKIQKKRGKTYAERKRGMQLGFDAAR